MDWAADPLFWEKHEIEINGIKINNTEAKDTVDKDIMTFSYYVISIWNMEYVLHIHMHVWIEWTCNVPVQYQSYQINCHNPKLFLSPSLFISVCLFFFIFFWFAFPSKWCVKPSLFKYTIWKREHEALSHKTISGSRETSTIFKWFLLLHAASTYTHIYKVSEALRIYSYTIYNMGTCVVWLFVCMCLWVCVCHHLKCFQPVRTWTWSKLSIAYHTKYIHIQAPKSNWIDKNIWIGNKWL